MIQNPQKNEAQKRILKATQACFFEEGFHAFSMDDLAKELGMSKKTIYRFFPSKIALVEAILDDFKNEMKMTVESVLNDSSMDFFRKLTKLPLVVMEKLSTLKQPFWRDMKKHAPESFRRIEEFRAQFIPSYFEEFLREGQEAGVISKELDVRIASHVLLAAIQRVMNPEFFSKMNMAPSDVGRQIFTILRNGILAADKKVEG